MATMNISLPDKMKAWVEKRTSGGLYANASDYVRDLIRRDEERERVYDEIIAAAEEGLASGISPRSPAEIREKIRQEADEVMRQHGLEDDRKR